MPAWSKIRNKYPALKNYLYLDTAGTGVMSSATARTACAFYDTIAGHGNSKLKYHIELMEKARAEVAALVGAEAGEIAFVPNTSHGMNILALMLAGSGDVVTNASEFPSSTVPWIHHRYKMNFVKPRKNKIFIEDVEKAAGTKKGGIIVHSFVQFATGFRQDMKSLGRLARKKGRYFIANITQGCGAFPIDVKKWDADAACCTGIKWLCAGEGAGFIYVSRKLLRKFKSPLAGWFSVREPLEMNNKSCSLKNEACRIELGGPSFPNIHALGNSVKELRTIGVDEISERILSLTDYTIKKLDEIGIELLTPLAKRHRSGILLLKIRKPEEVAAMLFSRKVRVSARRGGLRVSLHFYNNRMDIDNFVRILKKLV